MAVKTPVTPRHQLFGACLQYWRRQRSLTQLALGQAMGWKDGSAINQMEKGTYNPTLSIIYRLAAVLDIAPAELFLPPDATRRLDLAGLSPPLQAALCALILNMKHECERHPAD